MRLPTQNSCKITSVLTVGFTRCVQGQVVQDRTSRRCLWSRHHWRSHLCRCRLSQTFHHSVPCPYHWSPISWLLLMLKLLCLQVVASTQSRHNHQCSITFNTVSIRWNNSCTQLITVLLCTNVVQWTQSHWMHWWTVYKRCAVNTLALHCVSNKSSHL